MDKSKVILGNMSATGARGVLLECVDLYAKNVLMPKAGYKPDTMVVTGVTDNSMYLAKPLARIRQKPRFHGWYRYDSLQDWLEMEGMPRYEYVTVELAYTIKMLAIDGTISEFCRMLRRYVRLLDSRYKKAMEHE